MFRIALLLASCVLVTLGEPSSVAQPTPSQPPKLTPAQQEKIKTRDRLEKEANKFQSEGKLAEARAAVEKSLAIERDVFGDAHAEVAGSLAWLTKLCLQAEDFPAAREYGKKALAARKQLHDESHWRTTDARLDLEDVELRAGLTEKQRADLDIAVRLTGESVRSRDRSEYQKAAEPAEKALALRRAVLGEKHTAYAESLNNLAVLYFRQSLFAKAEPLYRETLAVRKAALGEKHPDYADSLNNLALLYQSQGEHAKAEPLYMEALAVRKVSLGEKHPRYAISLNNLASAYSGQGFHAKAGPLLKEATGISEGHLEQTAAIQSESGQLTHTAANRVYLDNLLSLPRTDAAEVYGIAFRWRGAVTARQTFARAARGTDPVSLRTLDALRDVSRRLSNLVNNPPKPGPGVDVPKLLNDLDNQRETLEKALASQSKDFAKYRESRALKVADIQKLLPADAVLVDFLVYDDKIAAFVITPKSIVRVDLKANSRDVAEMVEDFRSPLSLKRTRPVQGAGDTSALRAAVWEPLVPHLHGVNLVLICPDGPLCRVPFAALRGADPKKYLIEEVGIAVIPVPRLLPELLADRPVGAASLLVVGDVDFSGDPGAGRRPGEVAAVGPTRAGGPRVGAAARDRGRDSDDRGPVPQERGRRGGHVTQQGERDRGGHPPRGREAPLPALRDPRVLRRATTGREARPEDGRADRKPRSTYGSEPGAVVRLGVRRGERPDPRRRRGADGAGDRRPGSGRGRVGGAVGVRDGVGRGGRRGRGTRPPAGVPVGRGAGDGDQPVAGAGPGDGRADGPVLREPVG